MTLNEFFSIITKDIYIEPYIVALKYKFDFEDSYTISNEYLDIDMDMPNHAYYPFVWLNDWYEGQTDIEVLGFKKLSEVQIIEPQENEELVAEIKDLTAENEDLYDQLAMRDMFEQKSDRGLCSLAKHLLLSIWKKARINKNIMVMTLQGFICIYVTVVTLFYIAKIDRREIL